METAPLTLVARQKESLKAARLSGSNPVGNGMDLHECLKLGIGGKSLHRVANAPALRQASLVTKPPAHVRWCGSWGRAPPWLPDCERPASGAFAKNIVLIAPLSVLLITASLFAA
jgi:hypothetical protein